MSLKTKNLFMVWLICTSVWSQSLDLKRHFGLGISFGNYFQKDRFQRVFAHNSPKIYLPINISKSFFIEPEMGLYKSNIEYYDNDAFLYSLFSVGIGIFYKINYGGYLIYHGPRAGYLFYNAESIRDLDTWPSHEKKEGFWLAYIIGGERFLISNLSLGVELQFNYTNSRLMVSPRYRADVYEFQVVPLLFVRFYF